MTYISGTHLVVLHLGSACPSFAQTGTIPCAGSPYCFYVRWRRQVLEDAMEGYTCQLEGPRTRSYALWHGQGQRLVQVTYCQRRGAKQGISDDYDDFPVE